MYDWADLYGRIKAVGEIVSFAFVPAAGFATNADRSMHEMSSINATVTKQPVVNLILLPRIDSCW